MTAKAIALTTALLICTAAHAQQRASSAGPTALTTQDYIDIQQLAARYAFAIDVCTNGGADFADLFVDEGVSPRAASVLDP